MPYKRWRGASKRQNVREGEREATVGLMTTNAINEEGCTGEGEISISENTLPIGMTYQSFEGALPNISAVHFQIPWNTIYNNLLTEPERECHYRYFTGDLRDFRIIREAMGSRWRLAQVLRFVGGDLGCPLFLYRNSSGPWPDSGGNAVTVRLI